MSRQQADFFNHYIPHRREGLPVPPGSGCLHYRQELGESFGFVRNGPYLGDGALQETVAPVANPVGLRMIHQEIDRLPAPEILQRHNVSHWTPYTWRLDGRGYWCTLSFREAFPTLLVTFWLKTKQAALTAFPDRIHLSDELTREHPDNEEIVGATVESIRGEVTHAALHRRISGILSSILARAPESPEHRPAPSRIFHRSDPGFLAQPDATALIMREIRSAHQPDRPHLVIALDTGTSRFEILAADLNLKQAFLPTMGQFEFPSRARLVAFLVSHAIPHCHGADVRNLSLFLL